MYGHLVMNLSAGQRSRVTVIGLIDARISGAIAVAHQRDWRSGASRRTPELPAGCARTPHGPAYLDTGSS
jgi:hypothetical protein